VSFTNYIILFKLLNWRRVGLQKICGCACGQVTCLNDGSKAVMKSYRWFQPDHATRVSSSSLICC